MRAVEQRKPVFGTTNRAGFHFLPYLQALAVSHCLSRARQGDRAEASLASSTRFVELDALVWSNNTVRVLARNVSGSSFDLGAAILSVQVAKRRVP